MTRKINEIAHDIIRDMTNEYATALKAGRQPKAPRQRYYAAWTYLTAMLELDDIKDSYFNDSAKTVVLYGLSNLAQYKGEKAKAYKAELKAIAGVK